MLSQNIFNALFDNNIPLEERKEMMIKIRNDSLKSNLDQNRIDETSKINIPPQEMKSRNGGKKPQVICSMPKTIPRIKCKNCNTEQAARFFFIHITKCYGLSNNGGLSQRYFYSNNQ